MGEGEVGEENGLASWSARPHESELLLLKRARPGVHALCMQRALSEVRPGYGQIMLTMSTGLLSSGAQATTAKALGPCLVFQSTCRQCSDYLSPTPNMLCAVFPV